MIQSINSQILKLLLIVTIFICHNAFSQTVGVVLSGGGSSGLAHIGVLKSLEANQIPIDYIAGTSMGAVIGGLYAAGSSIEEIESFFLSDSFKYALKGEINDDLVYFYKKAEDDPSWINIKANKDTLLGQILPSNVLNPVELDLVLLEALSGPSALSNYSFDSLFVPFRCVASDIQNKKQIVFSSGQLHKAIRASSTYPFFFRPIYVDGQLLFDGGLYNNFPSDVLYEAFSPDVIIGSKVSSNAAKPDPDELFSQLESMISSPTNFNLPCQEGIIISPKTSSFTLDFSAADKNISIGYDEANSMMDSIKTLVHRRVSQEEVNEKRRSFHAKTPDFVIGDITLTGEKESFLHYFKKIVNRNKNSEPEPFDLVKKKYARLFQDDKITYLFPILKYNQEKSAYDMSIRIHKEKDLVFSFGGNFSSKPINMGYVGAKMNFFGKIPKTLYAKSHFGKFYSSVQGKFRFDFHEKRPFYIEPEGLIQRWDYFKSFATFFDESKPPFILIEEEYLGINVGTPVRNRGILKFDAKYGTNQNNYYQTDNFLPTDTTDLTKLEFITSGLTWTRSSLNKKQFSNSGTFLRISGRLVSSLEKTSPGSTGFIEEETSKVHNWMTARIDYVNYFKAFDKIKFGCSLNGVFSTVPILSNYKSTILAAPSFQPIPESKTFFQEEFRAHKFGSAGLKMIYNPFNNIDFRLEGFIFQPVNYILENEERQAVYEDAFLRRYYIISSSAVFHSPLGPLSLSVNYYDKREDNFSWILNFGYLIFNRRSFD
ncbi:MAG: NTE family protein [Patiriisocius sp.]|jgi:NTE family protein